MKTSLLYIILMQLCASNQAYAAESLFRLHLLSELYSIVKPAIQSLQGQIANLSTAVTDEWLCSHAHREDLATVRFIDADELCSEEIAFTEKRLQSVQHNLSDLLQIDIPTHSIPRIALCCSGGGHRAMLFTFGFLKGLQETGLLDCITYMAGLSGSTWTMASWVASQKNLNDYLATLPEKLCRGLEGVKNPALLYILAKQLITKVMHGQIISLIDVYGPTLANTLLTDAGLDRLTVTLSDSHAHIANADLPLPIYTAVTPNIEPYEWIECTPFEIGSTFQQAFIPTWAYGRTFKDGRSTNFAGEQSLGYMMGMFGSAFEFDLEDAVRYTPDAIDSIVDSLPAALQPIMRSILDDLINSPLDDVRLAPSSLPNFTYKAETQALHDHKHLTLVDGGMSFNLPFPPLLRKERSVDIILVCDASANIIGCQALHWAEDYMRAKNIPFPPIDYEKADKQVMTIFQDPSDPSCPIIVYFPCIQNCAYSTTFDPLQCEQGSYCATMNFTYNADQINELMGLSEYAIKQYAPEILALTKGIIDRAA